MRTQTKLYTMLTVFLLMGYIGLAQSIPTLELTDRLVAPGLGPNTTQVTIPFEEDALNNSNFSMYTPALSFTVSFRNQAYTGLSYSNISTGMVFGGAPTLSSGGLTQQVTPNNKYDFLGAYGSGLGGPTSNMFTSNPTATGAQLGTGFDITGDAFGNGVNSGVEVFTAAQVLYDLAQAKDGRYLFGEIVLTFSRPVKNPVIHVAGLGGSYRYLPAGQPDIPSNYKASYFSTELELQNTGVTSTKMSGTEFLSLSGNNILNSAAKPNGGSVFIPTDLFDNYGAATGSIRINGTVQQVVYKVYLRGSAASDINFSTLGSNVTGGIRNPFSGDQWYIAASLDQPTPLLISGYVFDDANGLTDGNINLSGALPNTKTNADGTLYANLIKVGPGTVVASVPVSSDGSYLFDNLTSGNYTVQLSSIAGTVGAAPPAATLPAGWVNTGEFIGSSAGSDGTVNSLSSTISLTTPIQHVTEVNFGINRLPESVDFTKPIPTPTVGSLITLNNPPLLPVLTGSDAEDMPVEAALNGKTVMITSLPTNTTLYYNGSVVTTGQIITSFDPALLQILITAASVGSLNTSFTYAYVDAAGFADATPATYKLVWAGGAPLPVTGVNLKASLNGKDVVLNWKTSSEYNSKQFEIERSTDAANFKLINTKAAAGTSFNELAYSFTDANMTAKIYFYRLRLVDLDGKFTYSNVAVVRQTENKGIRSFPNPVASQLNIEFANAKGAYIISMFNQAGQEVQSTRANIENSVQYVTLQRNNLTAGAYFVRITNIATAEVHTEKIILQ